MNVDFRLNRLRQQPTRASASRDPLLNLAATPMLRANHARMEPAGGYFVTQRA